MADTSITTPDFRSKFLSLVKGEYCRAQGLDLLKAIDAAGIELRDVRAGDRPGVIEFVFDDGVVRQETSSDRQHSWLSTLYLRATGDVPVEATGYVTVYAEEALTHYRDETRPMSIVERSLKARATAAAAERAAARSSADRAVIEAYLAVAPDLRDAFGKVVAYLALIEQRQAAGNEDDAPVAMRLHELMREAASAPTDAKAADKLSGPEDIDVALRSIVTDHTRVGGYPDTLGIARAAYKLGSSHKGERIASGDAPMTDNAPTIRADVVAEAPIDWQGDLVAEHADGPVNGSPAARKAGTVVAVTVYATDGREHMSVFGIPGFANGMTVHRSGSSRSHWRIRNARPGEIIG